MVYMLLEYADNGCLFFYIHATEGLPESLALRFFYQTALAVQYLHSQHIIHRDIKPENILLDAGFNVKLCDFGWSCYSTEEDMRTSICGTFEYMSPEVVVERQHSFKVDVWCLGILLYEFLHGEFNRRSALHWWHSQRDR
jgi:aurora kinase